MTPVMPELLAAVDTAKLRSSPAQMRAVLQALADRGRGFWTGPLDALTTALEDVGRVDVCLARLVEGHADAMRILEQAGVLPGAGVYGVWASRSAGTGLRASSGGAGWRLAGELRFASGIGLIDRALASAWLDADHHLLFDIDAADVDPDTSSWNTAAMDASRSFTVQVDTRVPAEAQVGEVDFYLSRPGFAIGGLAVAAGWAGGARHVVDAVVTSLGSFVPTAHQNRRVGLMEQAVWTADLAIASTTARISELPPAEAAAEIGLARTAVVLACETVLAQAPAIVGPGGLSTNARLARVLADLAIYIRQHHLDDQLTSLGSAAGSSHELIGL